MHQPLKLIPRCSNALAKRRRRKSSNQFLVADPASGNLIALNPPKDTIRSVDLMAAMELAKAGNGSKAVMDLVHPFRLKGPNPRPDLFRVVFKALTLTVKKSNAESSQ